MYHDHFYWIKITYDINLKSTDLKCTRLSWREIWRLHSVCWCSVVQPNTATASHELSREFDKICVRCPPVFFIQLGSVTTASGGGGVGVFAGMSDWHLGRHSSDSFGIARHTSLRGARQPEHAQYPRHPGRRTNQPSLLSSSSSWGTSLLNSSHLTAVLRWQGG